ncbi:carboxylating nicotinate-nucleotide diphosphorylase [Gracilibacillus caseinilyticus]|uniref:nicotinate-nucleotide diphosphorylase (carboxylating) n=1 Tax=Gracilibacillus caseinilyticus TaxID=2932256 RepID=A0ABY4EST3_9BACI|nr:carboxylating nicotinate-nucleotide diphosphorylase [Gracilibacillus caseinilyticus]UOQ47314.1 carboxylating nicotinate-nucleotide diphosphorylase [Gracilibacillus caseinilyticus]
MNRLYLRQQLESFLHEDIGFGDQSTTALFPDQTLVGEGKFIAKQEGIFAGGLIIEEVFRLFGNETTVNLIKEDGEHLRQGDVMAKVTGPYAQLLTAERVILNLLQRLSGIATVTNQTVSKLSNSEVRLTDTRKTTPGLRMLEKYAVRCGGGVNHRFGLDDAIMLKDNHIVAAGSISNAVSKVRSTVGHMIKIEVEIENQQQLQEAIDANVDVIMFDNMSPAQIKQLIDRVPEHIVTEASGSISMENIAAYSDTGVHMISLGFLTHSAQALDISFSLVEVIK